MTSRKKLELGKARAAVLSDAAGDVAVTATDQHFGDRLAQLLPRADRLQMRLTFGIGEIDQIGLLQPRRQFQHRPGDGDVIVIGQRAHQFEWRVGDRRQAIGELGARLVLDFLDQQSEYVVEQIDMRLAIGVGTGEK